MLVKTEQNSINLHKTSKNIEIGSVIRKMHLYEVRGFGENDEKILEFSYHKSGLLILKLFWIIENYLNSGNLEHPADKIISQF